MKAKFEGLRKLQTRDPTLRFRYDELLDTISYLRGNLADVIGSGAEALRSTGVQFFNNYPDLFGEVDLENMTILQYNTDPLGGRTVTLQQYHDGYTVHDGTIRLHATKDGILDTVANHLYPDLNKVPTQPKLTAEKAIKVVQKRVKSWSHEKPKAELVVYRHREKVHLAWEIRLNDTQPKKRKAQTTWLAGDHGAPAEWIAYVDAINGNLLLYYDNVKTAGPVVGDGTGFYSGVTDQLKAWFNNTTYQLRDTTRTAIGGPEIITDDEDGASPSEDPNNNWNYLTTSPRHQNQGAEVDPHVYAADVFNYFQIVHGRNSIDGSGGNIPITAHYGTNENNAYWSSSLLRLRIGDGSGVAPGFNYFCASDIVSHEFTHGVTQFTCNLQYQNEPGALNEAFSDVFAAFITGDWLIREECWLNPTAPAMRNMIDPTNGGLWNLADPINSVLAGHQPNHYSVRYTGSWDYGGVHINSGIINNLFYLLTSGGTHTVSGIAVTGIGQPSTEQMLYRCMTVNLVGNTDATFLEFREAMLDACLDLFPFDLLKLTQTKNAFNAVGIGPDIYVRDNVADNGQEPFMGAYLYASPDIINRISPSANPAVDFANPADDTLWQNVESGQDNYIYVRLQNRGSHNGDATISIYFSAATTFGSPASWIPIGTLTETGIAPGALRITGPLTFPSALIPGPGHYCMIAVISSSLDPAPDHTLITSISDYLNFVRNTNNIAYRNMDVVDLLPDLAEIIAVDVQTLVGIRERFDLQIDVNHFVPGAKIRIRGPSHVLGGAIAYGLKLVTRAKDQNIYEILPWWKMRKQYYTPPNEGPN